jgi:hypothetical protein
MKNRKIKTIITAATGDRVVVGESELLHAIEGHFDTLPEDIFLELLERILKDPTTIYEEESKHLYHLFYKLQNDKYLVAVIKKTETGTYFATMYPTGKEIRNKHKGLKKVKTNE